MRFNNFCLFKIVVFILMNSNVTVPVSTRELLAIGRELQTANRLFDVLVLSRLDGVQIVLCVILRIDQLSFLIFIEWLCLKDVKHVRF
jgi:hypothetical protein